MTCALNQVWTILGVCMYYFLYYIKPVWPLLSTAFVINSLKCRKILLFSVVKSSINFSIFGLRQKYRLIYIPLRSWYREHCNIKWNSSSKTSQFLKSVFATRKRNKSVLFLALLVHSMFQLIFVFCCFFCLFVCLFFVFVLFFVVVFLSLVDHLFFKFQQIKDIFVRGRKLKIRRKIYISVHLFWHFTFFNFTFTHILIIKCITFPLWRTYFWWNLLHIFLPDLVETD